MHAINANSNFHRLSKLPQVQMLIPKGLLASTTNPQNHNIKTSRPEHNRRPPLLPSEKNESKGISIIQKTPKSRIMTSSRYLSPSTSNSSSSSPSSKRYTRNSTPLSNIIGSGNAIKALRQLMLDERRPLVDGRSSLDSMPSNISIFDSDNVSSGSTSGAQDCNWPSNRQNRPPGLVMSSIFWQETNSRLRRLHDPGTHLLTSPVPKLIVPPKLKQYTNNGSLSSSVRGVMRPTSPSRGHSPPRIRNVALSYGVDARRGKVGENRALDAQLLRLVYNRHLQWRFVNARTEAVFLVQKRSVEKNLWNAWLTISNLYDTVTRRRYKLQLLRQKLKLASILKGQMNSLEDWACVDEDHSISLLGAIEALTASTLRLPVVGGATANIRSLQDAIGSASDIMQSMASSTCLHLPMVEKVNSLVSEVAKVTSKEQALLEECTEFISLLAAIQVKDSSLRTYILQHNCV